MRRPLSRPGARVASVRVTGDRCAASTAVDPLRDHCSPDGGGRGAPDKVPLPFPELDSTEGSTSVRTTRRSKVNFPAKVVPEPPLEKTKQSEAKMDAEKPLQAQASLNRRKAVNLADSVAELQADGDISEAESNCSSVSGLQTPLFIRITRRRKIVVPCPPETPTKSRQSKKAPLSEGSRCQEDDDISEAESCSSTVSGVRTPSVARMTRIREVKTTVSPVCEAQAEEVSDTESWCSGISAEQSVQSKRITRSMGLRLAKEAMPLPERKSEAVVEEAKMTDCVTKSETIVISDSEQPTNSDLDVDQASSLSTLLINEKPSPCKTKGHSESVLNNDPKQIVSGSPPRKARECTKKSPKKDKTNERNCESVGSVEVKIRQEKDIKELVTKQMLADVYEIAESTEEVCDLTLEKSIKVTKNQSPIKNNLDISPYDDIKLDQSSMPLKQTTADKNKSNVEPPKMDTGKVTQYQVEEAIEVGKPSKIDSPQKNILQSRNIESNIDDCRISVASSDSDGRQDEPVAESSSHTTKTGHESHLTVSLLTSDEGEESENSDIEEINEVETIASSTHTSKKTTTALHEAHSEELFVIDKTPGLDSTRSWYLEEKDTEGNKQSEESSELEDSEEEFIDEEEDLINENNKILSFSSSIDPGLNVKNLGGSYISFDAGKQKSGFHRVVPLKEKKKDELLKKSVITPDFEKKESVPPLKESVHQLKKQRRAEREKTTGNGWFGMKAPEMTDELKNDLKALKMRAAIDPKRFYKKNDREGVPKYFQVGTVVDSPIDFYHARIPKKERKKNIVEELLADSEFRRYNKRKYQDIIAEKSALAAGKKYRKKKKFRT
ncbi:LOW QUALITY PROTEIN: deoxynucleotidyltransferase terminal-interacting protein 2 [Podarcis raffonei]|uniref:LOW QUALITY PROTEIN: deoxynucleotidyltransferase terminal-interacting protein 2 n=1 Tax=Podarcis raffonei TaxID=65483 RepID=UPI0023298653|nr:LOW QUALITY PROTEIN: deoxynucleotidyltransferase terminal-interacting protein 2 [Podarcis raffonei]